MSENMWVLFDLDGTLTRSEEGIWNCARHTLRTMGYPEPDAVTLRQYIGPPLFWSFRNLAGMGEEEALRAIDIYRARYNTVGLFENRVYPGIRAALRALKKAGAHLGVVTGKPALPTGKILEHFGLRKFFGSVVCAADNRADKEAMIRSSLPEGFGEAWMVGDRKFDMEGGRLAGIHTLGVPWGYGSEEELRESGAEKLARTPREMAELLCPGVTGVKGAFLSMEGPDGSGKGTQLERLRDTLDRFGFEVLPSREPGGTPIGEKIRQILLDRENTGMADETEALLYAASRAQHVREVIRPAVAAGRPPRAGRARPGRAGGPGEFPPLLRQRGFSFTDLLHGAVEMRTAACYNGRASNLRQRGRTPRTTENLRCFIRCCRGMPPRRWR